MKTVAGFEHFIVQVEDGIAYCTINRAEVNNALNEACFADICELVEFVEDESTVKIAIITGAGEKAFISGADIHAVKEKTGVRHLKKADLEHALRKLENCTKPVIAAINGYAFGGGFELAMVCDIRIASENARFGLPETNLGIYPGAGGTQRLSRLAGIGVAKEVIMAGRVLKPDEAQNLGIVMKVVPLESLLQEAVTVAKKMMDKGPLALMIAKKVINTSLDNDLATGLLIENLGYSILMDSKDKREGTQAFLEKRPPRFLGE